MTETQTLHGRIPEEMAGMRLDQALAQLFSDYSRSRLQQWIRLGHVQVDGRTWRGRDKVSGGETVVVQAELSEAVAPVAQKIALDVAYEDEAMLVINKPAGLVVHPAAGNPNGTLLNALLHHAPDLQYVPRAGIVHRLDKDTSGLLVVARTLPAQKRLVEQLQARTMSREYKAVVVGRVISGGTVDAPLGRHPVDRKRMAVRDDGKPAVTHYRVAERFAHHTALTVRLETGRTHQIRVHMAFVNFPLLGDPVYGGRLKLPRNATPALTACLRQFRRQALHAARLGLDHPGSGARVEWEAPLPEDLQRLLACLREEDREGRSGE